MANTVTMNMEDNGIKCCATGVVKTEASRPAALTRKLVTPLTGKPTRASPTT